MLNLLIGMTERGMIPDPLVRFGIRNLCRTRLDSLSTDDVTELKYVEMLRKSPIAVETDAANEQHYELPALFFQRVLGQHLKYSCAHFGSGVQTLEQAEASALDITIERAEIRDGMNILELGCGWGSLSLRMAEKFPRSQITAVSNSASQREFIEGQAKARGLHNLRILTKNVAHLEGFADGTAPFDRVVSVEMFEHLRNYELILHRIHGWLKDDGKLFVHIFTHRQHPYLFETEGSDNWMGKYFFTGGQMPSRKLLTSFQKDMKLEKQWEWDGTHYQKTSEAWLLNMDRHRDEIMGLFRQIYGDQDALKWFNRWRVFFLAVAELFGYRNGQEWAVSHYRFTKNTGSLS